MPRIKRTTNTGSGQGENAAKGTRQVRAAYILTCSKCRARKIKCDGGQPECKICLAYGERCHYDKAPPMSQVLAMATRIKELEAMLEHDKPVAAERRSDNSAPSDESTTAPGPPSLPRPLSINYGPLNSAQKATSPASGNHSADSGDTPYYESTSAVEDNLPRDPFLTEYISIATPTESLDSLTGWDEKKLRFWEAAAVRNCATLLQLSHADVSHLLQTHWTWIHPAFMFVSRPIFLQNAAVGGQYCSQLLLSTICLHSARYTRHHLAEELQARTRLLLGQSLHESPSIPLIQSLLQLSAREMGNGQLSQAWLYSGMAFRMVVDIGLFIPSKIFTGTPIFAGLAQQLAWSSYLWDKTMSLYLGRIPILTQKPCCEPPTLDESAETMSWYPYFEDAGNTSNKVSHGPAYTISCFANFCKLSVIINDILLTIYAGKSPDSIRSSVQDMDQQLDDWYSQSPSHLLINPDEDRLCPPPHIISQNLLFYTSKILLHRPFRRMSTCRTAAAAVERILILLGGSLGLSRSKYLVAYCAYTAATVALLDLHDGIPGSNERIETYLRALHAAQGSCPNIKRSIEIIMRSVSKAKGRTTESGTALSIGADLPHGIETSNEEEAGFDPLPAFMFDQHFGDGQDGTGLGFLPFGELDSFAFGGSDIPDDPFDFS